MNQNRIGEFIQRSRKEKGWTQKELAEQIGVSDKTISKWENGNSVPDTGILASLCEVLEISVNELISGEKLPSEDYTKKAEENIMNLLQENQEYFHRSAGSWIYVYHLYCEIRLVFRCAISADTDIIMYRYRFIKRQI